MKKKFKVLGICVLVLMIGLIPLLAYAEINIPSPTDQFYVNDFTNILSDEEEKEMMKKAIKLADDKKGAQVVVTTVKSLNGEAIDDFAFEMYNEYQIGKDDVGTLILLSTKDRKLRIQNGNKMEEYLSASKSGILMDEYAIPYLQKNQFNKGLLNLQDAVIKEVSTQIAKEEKENANNAKEPNRKNEKSFPVGAVFIAVLIAIVLVILIVNVVNQISKKIREKEKERKEEERRMKRLEQENRSQIVQIRNLKLNLQEQKDTIENLTERLNKSNNNYKIMENRYKKAKKIYPKLDNEIDKLIENEKIERDKKIASDFEGEFSKVIEKEARRENCLELSSLLNQYNKLSKRQCEFIKSDISLLKEKRDEAYKKQKIFEREEKIRKDKEIVKNMERDVVDVIDKMQKPKAKYYETLKKTMKSYMFLTSEQQQYFDEAILERLKYLYVQSEKLHIKEEKERRLNKSVYRTSSSSSSSNSNNNDNNNNNNNNNWGSGGGFGGSSGGGGASRSF